MCIGQVVGTAEEPLVQSPPLGEELLQRPGHHGSVPHIDPHPSPRAPATVPRRAVEQPAVEPSAADTGPSIGQAESPSRRQHRQQAVTVEGTEHDTAPTRRVTAVQADVDLAEAPQIRQRPRPPEREVVHAEEDQADVRPSLVKVWHGAGGQQPGHLERIGGPVQEHQVPPALPEEHAPHRTGSQRRQRFHGPGPVD